MKVEKEVYPPIEKQHTLMFRAERSLLDKMQSYLLQPNEWQFILQCAWVLGFEEGLEERDENRFKVDLEDEEHE